MRAGRAEQLLRAGAEGQRLRAVEQAGRAVQRLARLALRLRVGLLTATRHDLEGGKREVTCDV